MLISFYPLVITHYNFTHLQYRRAQSSKVQGICVLRNAHQKQLDIFRLRLPLGRLLISQRL